MNNSEKIKQAAEILSKAKNIVGFTGAGTSAESGIPPFRGEGGIWNQYDPNSLDIDFYYRHTKESWKIIREVFYNFFSNKDIKRCSITSSATRTSSPIPGISSWPNGRRKAA